MALVFNSNFVREEGGAAYRRGAPEAHNPYRGSGAEVSWRLGWVYAAVGALDFSWAVPLSRYGLRFPKPKRRKTNPVR